MAAWFTVVRLETAKLTRIIESDITMARQTMGYYCSCKRKEAELVLLIWNHLKVTILEKNLRCRVVYVFIGNTGPSG